MITIACRSKSDPRGAAVLELAQITNELADVRHQLSSQPPRYEVRRLTSRRQQLEARLELLQRRLEARPAEPPAPRLSIFTREQGIAAIRLWLDNHIYQPTEEEADGMAAAMSAAFCQPQPAFSRDSIIAAIRAWLQEEIDPTEDELVTMRHAIGRALLDRAVP